MSAEELMLLKCGVREDSWDPLDCKEIQPVNPKGNQSWVFIGRTDAKAEALVLWHLMWRAISLIKTLMLGKTEAGGEGDDRGWDGWMAAPTQWTWVWASSGRSTSGGLCWIECKKEKHILVLKLWRWRIHLCFYLWRYKTSVALDLCENWANE